MYKKILLINPFGIGDVLFTTPIIHTLKEAIPSIKIGYLCNRRTAFILERNPYINYIFIYDRDEFESVRRRSFFNWLKKFVTFLNQIKKEQFDVALDFSLNIQYGFFSWFVGIRQRIGYDYKKRGKFLTKKANLTGYSEKHIVEYYTDLLKYLGLDAKYSNLEFYLNEKDKKRAEEILSTTDEDKQGFIIGVIPGGGRSWGKDAKLKHWSTDNFANLADKIIANYQAKIIIMGDYYERELAREIIEKMHYKAIDLSGSTSIGEFAALMSKTDLIITNDGGPLHVAVALGKKTVSFFGPVDPKVYGPYPPNDDRHIVLRKILDCNPCYHKFRLLPCEKNKQCLEMINVEEAFAAVNTLLKQKNYSL